MEEIREFLINKIKEKYIVDMILNNVKESEKNDIDLFLKNMKLITTLNKQSFIMSFKLNPKDVLIYNHKILIYSKWIEISENDKYQIPK